MFESISVSELKKLYNVNIIDIRSAEKYNDNHILNARHIPYEKLIVYPNKYLNRNEIYYIYCQRGSQSKTICQILKNDGFNVVNISGGYEAWILSE